MRSHWGKYNPNCETKESKEKMWFTKAGEMWMYSINTLRPIIKFILSAIGVTYTGDIGDMYNFVQSTS